MTQNDDHTFELISAYLDGELSSEEAARVESLLEESEEHRRFLEELRHQRTQFAALPPVAASPDLHERILAAVEQSQPAWQQVEKAEVERADPESPRRTWLAPALLTVAAIAAVVVITVALVRPNGGDIADPKKPNGPIEGGTGIAAQNPPKIPDTPIDPPDDPSGVPPGLLIPVEFDGVQAAPFPILEYLVTDKGFKQQAFEKTLARHNIKMNDTLQVDDKAQSSIRDARMFNTELKTGVNVPGDASTSMYVLVGDIDVLFQMTEDFSKQKDVVVRWKMNLAILPKDMDLLRQLGRVQKERFAAVNQQLRIRAYRFALQRDLQTFLFGASALTTQVSMQATTTDDPNADPSQVGGPSKADLAATGMTELPVIIILHNRGAKTDSTTESKPKPK